MIPLFKPHGDPLQQEEAGRQKAGEGGRGGGGSSRRQDSMTAEVAEKSPRSTTSTARKQQSLPQALFKRQYAVDQPPGRSSNPAIIFSTNNSADSATSPVASGIPDRTAQRLRQEKFGKTSQQHSSVNSSIRSNGDVRSFLNRSRKSSLFDLRESALRKFSIIPQVSQCCLCDLAVQPLLLNVKTSGGAASPSFASLFFVHAASATHVYVSPLHHSRPGISSR